MELGTTFTLILFVPLVMVGWGVVVRTGELEPGRRFGVRRNATGLELNKCETLEGRHKVGGF